MAEFVVGQPRVHVVAGILRDANGQVLLAQRPAGKQDAGCWEFPGGKVDPGENPQAALARELHEELGIRASVGRRRIAVACGPILLDVYEVAGFDGTVHPREGQRLGWIAPEHIDRDWLPRADRPVVSSLCLPDRYLITPVPDLRQESRFLAAIEAAVGGGIRLVQLRLPGWSRRQIAPLARHVREICQTAGARVLLNGDWQMACVLGLDGVHLPARLARGLRERPLALPMLVGVSCHDRTELANAAAMQADFATLSPVYATASHPESPPLGWERAGACLAEASLPVYALGGLGRADEPRARELGFQGIAAIRGHWPDPAE